MPIATTQAQTIFPDMSIFTEDERTEVESLLVQITPRLGTGIPHTAYEQLTDNELTDLLLWTKLYADRVTAQR